MATVVRRAPIDTLVTDPAAPAGELRALAAPG